VTMGLILLSLFLLFLFLNLPIYLALILSSAVALIGLTQFPPEILIQRMFSGIDSFTLMAIPFFIFAANLMNRGGLASRIVKLANMLVGHIPGGLAFAVTLACMFLGTVSGSSPATVVAICSIMMPMMIQAGYGQAFTIGLIIAASSVAVIIPPSIGMIIYGAVTGTSVGELFAAGFLPGIIYGFLFMAYSYYYAKKKKIPVRPRAGLREIGGALRDASFALGFPVVVLGGIYGGICTPTEAAGIGCVYSIVVGLFVYREMSLKDLPGVAFESSLSTAQQLIILAGASVFAWMMTRFQVPAALAGNIMAYGMSEFTVLMLMNIVMLIAGMLIDPASFQMILAPIFLPIAVKFGVHPVHLGIIMVVNGAIGMFTPPFGLNLFVATGITKVPLREIIKPEVVGPWIILGIGALLIITYLPAEVILLLPKLLAR